MLRIIALTLLLALGCTGDPKIRSAQDISPRPVSLLPSDGVQVFDGGWLYRLPCRWPLVYCTADEPGWLGLPDYDAGHWDWLNGLARGWGSQNFIWDSQKHVRKTWLARYGEQTPLTLWYDYPDQTVYFVSTPKPLVGEPVAITIWADSLTGIDFYCWFVFDGPAPVWPHPDYPELYYLPPGDVFSAQGLDSDYGVDPLRYLLAAELAANQSGKTWPEWGFDYLRYETIQPPGNVTVWSAGVWTGGLTPLIDGSGPLCTRVFAFTQPGDYTVWFCAGPDHSPRTANAQGEWLPVTPGPPLLIRVE